MFFGDSAYQVNKIIHPNDLSPESPYIGLEHIEQESLQLIGIGNASKLTSNKKIFRKGDILFGKLRPYFRKVINADFDGICSTDIWVIRPKENIDSNFLYYWCSSWKFINFVNSASEGTRMPRAKWEVAINHEIPNHTYENQKIIGNILGSLDKKIQLNKKTNETLEEIVKALFKSWFIDFDPVKAKAKGCSTGLPDEISDLFPDSFDQSELGKIPKNWLVSSINELNEITMGQSPPGSTYNESGEGLPFYQGKTDFGFRHPTRRIFCSEPKRLAEQSSTLLSVRAPVGSINLANESCCIGRGLASIKSKQGHHSYTYYLLNGIQSLFDIYNSEGTVFGAINKNDLSSILVVKSPSKIRELFNEFAIQIDHKISLGIQEIKLLTSLRDTLLPKLISGSLSTCDVERKIQDL